MQWQLRLPLALGALGLVCLLGAGDVYVSPAPKR